MANTDPVSVTVEIVDNFSDDIQQLRTELESLEREIGVTLDIDDNGSIQWADAQLEDLEQIIEAILNVDSSDVQEAMAMLEALDGKVTKSTHVVDVKRQSGLTPNDIFSSPGTVGSEKFRALFGDPDFASLNKNPGYPDLSEYEKDKNSNLGFSSPFSMMDNMGENLPVFGNDAYNGIVDAGKVDPRMSPDKFKPEDYKGTFPDGRPTDVPFKNYKSGSGMPGEDVSSEIFREMFGQGDPDINFNDPRFKNFISEFSLPDNNDKLMNRLGFFGHNGDQGSNKGEFNIPDGAQDAMKSAGFTNDLSQSNMKNRVVSVGGETSGPFPGGVKNPFDLSTDERGNEGGSKFRNLLSHLKPSMRKWMSLVAALLPMIISLTGALGGLITALGAVGVAGMAAFRLGKWGLDNAQQKIKAFKQEVKSVFEPASDVFAPILSQFLNVAPSMLQPLVGPLKKLTQYEDTFYNLFGKGIKWVGLALEKMAAFEPVISKISSKFVSAFGQTMVGLLQWLTMELARNWEKFSDIAGILGKVVFSVYTFAKAVSFALANLSPLFNILVGVAKAMSTKFGQAVMTGVAVTLLLVGALKSAVLMMGLLGSAGIMSAVKGLAMYIGKALVAIGVTAELAATIAMATAGLSVLLGAIAASSVLFDNANKGIGMEGMSVPGSTPAGAGTGTGGGDVYINIEGDANKDTLNKLNDKFDKKWKTYNSRENKRER